MTALLWKDYRLSRGVLLLGAALFVGPYAQGCLAALHAHWPGLPPAGDWPALLLTASSVSLAMSPLTLLILAANSIACERADRSAEFLAYLPPSRLEILVSKALLVLLAATLVWAVNLLVANALVPALGPVPANTVAHLASWDLLAASAVMAFGAGWLGSALCDSPALATCLGIGLSLAVPPMIKLVEVLPWSADDNVRHWAFFTGLLTLGVAFFVSGSVHYLRRVEP